MREKEDEISLVELYLRIGKLIRILWLRKFTLITVAIIGGILGFIFASLSPTTYESKLTFIVDQANSNKGLGALGGIASSFGFGGISGDGGLYENQANLMNFLKSRSVVESALLKNIPGTSETFAQRFIRIYQWGEEPVFKRVQFKQSKPRGMYSIAEDSILCEIYNYTLDEELIRVTIPDEEANIIAIDCSSNDDTLAKFFPKVLLDEVASRYVHAKTKLALDNVKILQHQTDSVRSELNQSLYSSAYQTDEVFGLNPAFNVKRVPANKEQIDVRASSILLEELIKNLELARVQLKDQTPLIEIIDEPRFPVKEIKPSKFKFFILFGGFLMLLYVLLVIFILFIKKLQKVFRNIET
jgi:hypothetical protein